jgi:hypothetical protein
MPGSVRPQSVSVSIRRSGDDSVVSLPWERATTEVLAAAAPWRTFRWHHGQRHFSGSYWSATDRGHVIYESRLELARLLFADFDASVNRIFAQPFLLRALVKAAVRRHVPDFLLLSAAGPIVVDVKPRSRLSKPEVSFTLAWTRELVEGRGWRYEVWSEPPEAELANLRFLAGFRRGWLFDCGLLDELRASDFEGISLGKACRSLPDWPEALVRSAIFHLLWTQHFTVDLTRPMTASNVLANGVRS